MGKNSESPRAKRAKCPFYVRDTPWAIVCEGLMDDTFIKNQYPNRTDLCKIQFDTFCAKHYERCEIYKAIMEAKYKEDAE